MKPWSLLAVLLLWLGLFGATAARADLKTGIEAYRSGDYAAALEALRPLAQTDDPVAQFLLGEMHLWGLGVGQDLSAAAGWYAKAAENGHAQAMANHGSLLMLGLGDQRDLKSAFYWLILSAVWTDSEVGRTAMTSLGQVAPQLSAVEKKAIGSAAARQWRRK